MKFHVEASKEFDYVYVLHCETNDLKIDKSPEDIAKNILEIGTQLKSEENEVYINSILTRRDELNEIGIKVNHYLQLNCHNYLLKYIDNSKIITIRYLNQSGLHVNKNGTKALSEHV